MIKPKRVLLATFGTLGDIYPFIAIAHALRRRGLDATIAAPDMHRGAIEREGLAYARLRPNENDIGEALGVDVPGAFRIMLKNPYFILDEIYLRFLSETYEDVLSASAEADIVITHSLLVGAHQATEMSGLPCARVALAPLHVQSAEAPCLTPPAPYIMRPRSQAMVRYNRCVRSGIRIGVNIRMGRLRAFRKKVGLPPTTEDFFLDFGRRNRVSRVFGLFSPRFAPANRDHPSNMVVPGFPFFAPRDANRRDLPAELRRFLASGDAPIVFTLGSFAPGVSGDFYDNSIATTRALARRAVLLAGAKDAARLASVVGADEFICRDASHSLLFPQASCIVHHGGIGTTAEALRAGKPQLVVPFFGDQPDHAERVRRLGVGLSLKLSAYDEPNATRALARLAGGDFLAAAENFAEAMKDERGVEAIVDWVNHVTADGSVPVRALRRRHADSF